MDSAPSTVATANDERLYRRLAARLSIQTKLMIILLLTSVASVAVVGFVEFQYGAQELQRAATNKLVQARELQRRAVTNLFADMSNSLVVVSGGGRPRLPHSRHSPPDSTNSPMLRSRPSSSGRSWATTGTTSPRR